MGHLTKISNHISDNTEKGNNSERIKKLIQGKLSFLCVLENEKYED